jgi:protein-S-isoprenylcysteine O-methyltransferase Ste14
MLELFLFLSVSAGLLYVSRGALKHPNSHGFYRLLAWECILGLVLLNASEWHTNPLAPHQLLSWLLLAVSIWLPVHAVRLLIRMGKPTQERSDAALFGFEKTSSLVTSGAFKYIRHPIYAELVCLARGVFLKQFTWPGLGLVLTASLLLFLTARRDEEECLAHFGDAYLVYMGTTKRFVPFLF